MSKTVTLTMPDKMYEALHRQVQAGKALNVNERIRQIILLDQEKVEEIACS